MMFLGCIIIGNFIDSCTIEGIRPIRDAQNSCNNG